MNIAYIEYSIAQKSLDIFFSGCNNKCKDCCNPQIMDFNVGSDWNIWIDKINSYLKDYDALIDRIFLVGGSPNHQDEEEMRKFFKFLTSVTNKDIWLFAGEELNTIKDVFKEYCSHIKVGAYIPDLKVDNNYQEGIKLATSNQRVLRRCIDY